MNTERPKRRPDLRQREVDGEILLDDRRSDVLHQLNTTASFIWELCDGEHGPEEIAEALARTFEAPESTTATDVAATLSRFRELELLAQGTEPSGLRSG